MSQRLTEVGIDFESPHAFESILERPLVDDLDRIPSQRERLLQQYTDVDPIGPEPHRLHTKDKRGEQRHYKMDEHIGW